MFILSAYLITEYEGHYLKPGGRVYFVDAAHLLHNAVAGYGWIARGKTVELKTSGKAAT